MTTTFALTFTTRAAADKFIADNGKKGILVSHSFSVIPGLPHTHPKQQLCVGIRYLRNRHATSNMTEAEALAATHESAKVAAPVLVVPKRDKAPGATRKLSITDRAVMMLIKGRTREQVIQELVENGATKESARCTAHFVFTMKVSKAHRAMIEAGKWCGYNAR